MKHLIFAFGVMLFFISCNEDTPSNQPEETILYGEGGTHQAAIYNEIGGRTSAYYPADISTMDHNTPVLFFISGWSNTTTAVRYDMLFRFIASRGYTVIYTQQGAVTNASHAIEGFTNFLNSANTTVQNSILPYLDTTKIGVLGHSAGGGITLTALKHFSDLGYGENGRLVMMYDPWYAFEMNAAAIQNLPTNTNVILQQYGVRGNNDANGTDARIPLTLYSLLTSIPNSHKDYQVYNEGGNIDHTYPYGTGTNYSEKQGILKPLDALMYFTFENNQNENARNAALENGSDNPYDNGNGIQEVLPNYTYPCDGANTIIDYCAIVP